MMAKSAKRTKASRRSAKMAEESGGMVKVNIRVPLALKEKAHQVAVEEGRTVSNVLRRMAEKGAASDGD